MKKIIFYCYSLFFYMSLHNLYAGYGGMQTTDNYRYFLQILEKDPHPWAKNIYKAIIYSERNNQEDLKNVCYFLQETVTPQPIGNTIEKAVKRLHADYTSLLNVDRQLKAAKIPIHNYFPLFTGITKMIGSQAGENIYKRSAKFIEEKWQNSSEIDFSSTICLDYYDANIPMIKTAFLYLYAAQGNIDEISDIVWEKFHNIDNNIIPNLPDNFLRLNDEIGENHQQDTQDYLRSLLLYDASNHTLYKPSASYEFGANPGGIAGDMETGRTIWDCSSFISKIIGCSVRLSTYDFWYIREKQKAFGFSFDVFNQLDFLKAVKNEACFSRIHALLDLAYPLPDDIIDHGLEFCDIVVWRTQKGGHIGFFLGYDEDNYAQKIDNDLCMQDNLPNDFKSNSLKNHSHSSSHYIILAHSNRTDDGRQEGTGISRFKLRSLNHTTFAFRYCDPRKN